MQYYRTKVWGILLNMHLALVTSLLLYIASVPTAFAAPEIEKRALNCNVVKDVVNYFTSYTAQASSFCSAYLRTSTTVTVATVATTRTVTVKTTITVTDIRYTTAANTFHKRDNSVARPTWLPIAIGSQLVSSACSCYITPPAPITVKATVTSGTQTTIVAKTTTKTVTTTVPIYCGVPGCGNGNGFIECPTGSFTLPQCKAQCQAAVNTPEGTCHLFQWVNDGSGICCLYSDTLPDQYADGTSSICNNQFFYDVNCRV